MAEENLSNYIKYCLGYVRLTKQRATLGQKKYDVSLPREVFDLAGLLSGEEYGELAEMVQLDTFYGYDPGDVPEEKLKEYEKEKSLAKAIDEICNKYKNDSYTKQIVLNFGYFEIEMPIEVDEDIVIEDLEENAKEEEENKKGKIDRHPLFTLSIRIEKEFDKNTEADKYFIYFSDPEAQVNLGVLEPVLGEDLYFNLLEELGKYETEGKLTLPLLEMDIFFEIWHKIKASLRLKEAIFDEESFSLEDIRISLSAKANYFLAEDLVKLSKLSDEDLSDTALTSWAQDDNLDIETDTPNERELYFPFLYDKYQLATLSIIDNKSSIIQGPPGTGKSETISNILCHLAATGKRVLFVSQKAQALKVVKDKLKALDVKYLYGYLPNPNSAQVGEEDEIDGIAPQLSAVGAHIQRLGYKFNIRGRMTESPDETHAPNIANVVGQKEEYKKEMSDIINAQRRAYILQQEFSELDQYDIEIDDFEGFSKSFSSLEWKNIKKLREEIDAVKKKIEQYKGKKQKEEFDEIFFLLELKDKKYSEIIKRIRDDVEISGYDRHFSIMRSINNVSRKIRLKKEWEQLPGEIADYIDAVLKEAWYRSKKVRHLYILAQYCEYFEDVQLLEIAEEQFQKKLSGSGVSEEEFKILDAVLDASPTEDMEEVKEKIVRVQEIKRGMRELFQMKSANNTSKILKELEQRRRERVAEYLQNIVNKNIIEKWQDGGVTMRGIIQKLSRAFKKSKRAFKTFDKLRSDPGNFNAILDLIPIWIMELDDASRIIPLEAGIFDYVVLDEASQCNGVYVAGDVSFFACGICWGQ